jgi:hypothetical protein
MTKSTAEVDTVTNINASESKKYKRKELVELYAAKMHVAYLEYDGPSARFWHKGVQELLAEFADLIRNN